MQALIKSERKTAQNSEINLSILITNLLNLRENFGPFNHIVIKGVLQRVCSKKGAVPVFLREASQNFQNCLTGDLHEFIRSFPKRQFGGKRAAHHAGPAAIR